MGGQIKPKVPEFVAMAVTKLAWTEEYATEKITPVMTRWQISQNNASQNDENSTSNDQQKLLEVVKVCKKRVVGGIASLSLEWRAIDPDLQRMYPESLESTEPYDLVKGHCPHLLEAFEESKKKKATTGRKRTQKEAKAPSQPITQFFTKTKQPHQKKT